MDAKRLTPRGGPRQKAVVGKSLVPDPERAPLIARAFEELATGRLTKQEVIARMTEAGLRTRRGLVLAPQSFGYYHCQRQCRAVNVSKVRLEGALVDELALLQPTAGYIRLV